MYFLIFYFLLKGTSASFGVLFCFIHYCCVSAHSRRSSCLGARSKTKNVLNCKRAELCMVENYTCCDISLVNLSSNVMTEIIPECFPVNSDLNEIVSQTRRFP